MLFYDKRKGHIIIGQAIINLAACRKEININSLITELGDMAECDVSDDRVALIADTRCWLKSLINTPGRNHKELSWFEAYAYLHPKDKND